jgi:flagellar motor switch protein FliN
MNELSTEEIEALSRALNRTPLEPANFNDDTSPLSDLEEKNPDEVTITKGQYLQHQHTIDLPQTIEQQDMLEKLPLQVEVILGKATLQVKEALKLHTGSVITLNTLAGEPVEITVNGKSFAVGEIVVVDEHLGIRIINLQNPS